MRRRVAARLIQDGWTRAVSSRGEAVRLQMLLRPRPRRSKVPSDRPTIKAGRRTRWNTRPDKRATASTAVVTLLADARARRLRLRRVERDDRSGQRGRRSELRRRPGRGPAEARRALRGRRRDPSRAAARRYDATLADARGLPGRRQPLGVVVRSLPRGVPPPAGGGGRAPRRGRLRRHRHRRHRRGRRDVPRRSPDALPERRRPQLRRRQGARFAVDRPAEHGLHRSRGRDRPHQGGALREHRGRSNADIEKYGLSS